MKPAVYHNTIILNRGLSLLAAYFFFMLLVRAKLTGTVYLFFLVWNVALAAIPYCITAYMRKREMHIVAFGLAFLAWLAFLPNAFYILTDLMHLEKSQPKTFWIDLVIFASATFTGFIFGLKSIFHMEKMLGRRFRRFDSVVFEMLIAILCGIGIFLGRVLRLNSWDFLYRPAVLADSLETIFLPSSIAFIFSISSFIWLVLTTAHFVLHKKSRS